jgi:hypothetical protein
MSTRIGTNRGEILRGTNRNDILDGRGGDDTLIGLSGNDLLINGPGDDRLEGGAGLDSLRLHQQSHIFFSATEGFIHDAFDIEDSTEVDRFTGIETILGSGRADTIDGSQATTDLHLFGAGGNDELRGGFGDDEISGETGEDDLSGAAGDDVLRGGRGHDRIDGGADTDEIYGDRGDDSLDGGTGNDRILGGMGDDIISDAEGNNTLLGCIGNDALFGGSGDDVLVGGQGRDFLRDDLGGNDTYVLGCDAPDTALYGYFVSDGDLVERIGDDRVLGFENSPTHVLDINLFGNVVDSGRDAFVDARDFLDSNDDGLVTADDLEVTRDGDNLVLDIGAIRQCRLTHCPRPHYQRLAELRGLNRYLRGGRGKGTDFGGGELESLGDGAGGTC